MVCPPCNCPQVYKPVCGEDRKTYSNTCQAGCAGVTIVHYGECRSPYPCRILQPEDLEGGDVNMSLLRPWLCPLPLEAP